MYSFGEDSPLTCSSNSYCLLSDRRSVAYIDYMLCSVEIMLWAIGPQASPPRSAAGNVTSILLCSGDTCIQC